MFDFGLTALKASQHTFKNQLKIALVIPIMIYVAALAILYKDRFDQKMFCGLNPFEKICKSPVSEIQSYDGISEGFIFLPFKLELKFFNLF